MSQPEDIPLKNARRLWWRDGEMLQGPTCAAPIERCGMLQCPDAQRNLPGFPTFLAWPVPPAGDAITLRTRSIRRTRRRSVRR